MIVGVLSLAISQGLAVTSVPGISPEGLRTCKTPPICSQYTESSTPTQQQFQRVKRPSARGYEWQPHRLLRGWSVSQRIPRYLIPHLSASRMLEDA